MLDAEVPAYKGIQLKGPKPQMAYKDQTLTNFICCLQRRFEDLTNNPVVVATKIGSLRLWPDTEDKGSYHCFATMFMLTN